MTYYNNGEETIRHEAVSRLIHFRVIHVCVISIIVFVFDLTMSSI